MEGALLTVKNISKFYKSTGVLALDKVTLKVKKGTIHAVIGENAAGKTTLMKIIAGLERKDEGEIIFKGKKLQLKSSLDAYKHGIGMMHQHFMLIEDLTVVDNIFLGTEPGKLGIYDRRKAEKIVREISSRYNLDIKPLSSVSQLSVGEKQKVELLKLLVRNAELLILDEPTAVLTEQEVESLFKIMRELKTSGKTIIFVTHKLNEVKEIADKITVLNRGRIVGKFDNKEFNEKEISIVMSGTTSSKETKHELKSEKNLILSIKGLCVKNPGTGSDAVKNVSIEGYTGELIGLTGVSGNGQEEFVNALFGMAEITSGKVLFKGKNITGLSPGKLRELGIAYIPSDRTRVGSCLQCSVLENLIAHKLRNSEEPGFLLNYHELREWAKEVIKTYSINVTELELPIKYLSGGNIQKIIIARELELNPDVLIVSEPTRGLDTAASQYVHSKLLKLKNEKFVLVVSSDLDEILKISDRIIVMYKGKIVFNKPNTNLTKQLIGEYMLGLRNDFPEDDTF